MKTVFALLFVVSTAFAQKALDTEEGLNGADRIRVNINLGAVNMTLKRIDNASKAFKIHYEYQENEEVPVLNYEVRDNEGVFLFSNGKHDSHFPFFNFGEAKDSVDIELANSVPLHLRVNFGVCDANVDLGGMEISQATFATGVCSFNLNFSSPNKINCHDLQIKTGVSSVKVENLANARASSVELNGGLGSMDIDFGGKLVRDCSVHVQTGLGSVNISIPSGMNTEITTPESFLTSVDVAGFYSQGGGVYRSNSTTGPELKIHVESALGGVKIRKY